MLGRKYVCSSVYVRVIVSILRCLLTTSIQKREPIKAITNPEIIIKLMSRLGSYEFPFFILNIEFFKQNK